MKKYIILLFVFIMGQNLLGQEQSIKKDESVRVPVLNGHHFLTSSHFKGSFINTKASANLGFGSTSLIKMPGIQIGEGEIFSFEGKIIFFNMNVSYQQRFTPWLAMFANYNMSGRVGGDISTILADGVNTLSGGEIGWIIRLMQSQKLNLSTSVNIQNLTGNFINVVEYVEEVIDGNPYPSVIKKVPAMSVEAGILGAYAFNPSWGLQFHAEVGYGESFEREETKTYVSSGISFEGDLLPNQNVPLGFGLGYSISSAPDVIMNNDGYSNLINAKIAYTGSKDYELGFQYTYYNFHIDSINDDAYISNFLLLMKFYF